MSEMVERIFERIADNHVAISGGASADDVRELARVIIAAMREPTEEMRDAVYAVSDRVCYGCCDQDGAQIAWQAMIDAALK